MPVITNPLALKQAMRVPLEPAKTPAPDLPNAPKEGEYLDLPARISTFSEWDSVGRISNAISQFEYGMFLEASLLADAVMRDDRVKAVVNTYVDGLLGLPFSHVPAGGAEASPKAKEVAEDVGHEWPTMIPQAQFKRWITNGEMLGLGIGELSWVKTESKWTPHLKVHHNQFCFWHWGTRTYWFQTQGGLVELVPGDPHWALYMPGGYSYGWMYALLRSIWMQWMVRQFTYRDWARYSEIHGLPIRGAIMPADASDIEKRAFLLDTARVGAETAIALKQAQDGDKFDLKLIEAVANSEQSFDKLIQRCEESIAIRVLGQNLSTQIRGGSFAAAQVHENIRQDIKESLASAVQADTKNQIIRPYVKFNFGDEELAPDPKWDTTPGEDKKRRAETSAVNAKALKDYADAGIKIDVPAYARKYEIPIDGNGRMPRPQPASPAGGKKTTVRKKAPSPSPGQK